jgi:hypothetical protein
MSVDVFFMRFADQDVQPVPLDLVRPVLERFATVTDDGIVTFEGQETEQGVLETDESGMLQQILFPRCEFSPGFQECAYALLSECGLCMFDDTLVAIYAAADVKDDIPPSLLDQMSRGLTLVERPDQIQSG